MISSLAGLAMPITWAAFNIKWQGDRPVSSAASVRYRLILPAQALAASGHEVRFLQLGLDSTPEKVVRDLSEGVLVLSKLSPDPSVFDRMAALMLDLITRARGRGMRVLLDVSDDHFSDPLRGKYLAQAVKECDGVVASTPTMAAIVRAHTARPVQVVGDPYEGPHGSPRFDPPPPWPGSLLAHLLRTLLSGGRRSRPLRLLWFGHESNLESLLSLLPRLRPLTARYPIEVHLVTSPRPEIVTLCERLASDHSPALKVRLSAWSTETVWAALKECDIVMIPSSADDPAKAVKSPNRLIEGIRAGRFVCASPVPSYQEFSRYSWIGEDLVAGVEWALSHRNDVIDRLKAGQEHIAQHHSPEAIARQWKSVLATGHESGAAAATGGDSRTRLNLGCGDKILPGYINVDVADGRNETVPDVICDVRRLSVFSDDTADEILSVHVVEHFWRWEVLDVLKDWVRVLRPGGRMILECPNLISACEDFLADPEGASGPGRESQRTMWVLYGDPAWRDPLMVHRWGYTPASLGRLMAEAGLVNIRQEPAQFKLREPRDMRVVGEKPV